MKIHDPAGSVGDAANDVLATGVAVIEGTTTPATIFAEQVKNCLKKYPEVDPVEGFQEVPNAGYLYYLRDANLFDSGSDELKELIFQIDASNPIPED